MNLLFLLQVIYFLLPAAFANMTPVFMRNHFKFLAYPVDFNKKVYNKRVFGDRKTFRGFVFGILAAVIIVFMQKLLYGFGFFQKISLINYSSVNFLVLGFLIGFGCLFGDLIGAFIKRRLDFKPGESFFVLDQVNNIFGIALFVTPFYFSSWKINLWFLLIWFLGHLIIKYLGFIFKIDKKMI